MVCGSTVLAQGRFRRRISTNSYLSSGNSSFIGCRLISITIIRIIGISAQQLSDLGSSTVRASGVIVVECRARLLVGRFRRQIGTESCHRVGSQAYQLQQLSGLAAADTGSSFFVLVALLA